MTYKAIKNIMICAVLLAGFFLGGCNQQSEGERTPGKKTGSDNSTPMPTPAGQSTPSGQPTPNPVPGGATSSGTCLDQWKAYTTYFTVGRAIKFNTSVLAQGQNFPATHDEKILTSD
ncbi:MAG: hypothetical protein NTV34_12695, partial [Proteobacteria bacterium]|nr:hypothetical protein [Pseudomonadota bacterium]